MNILILTTTHGRNRFAKQMCREAHRLGHKAYTYFCTSLDKAFANHPEWTPDNLIIHSRAANPNADWMKKLVLLEAQGYRVVNKTDTLRLTSDKWAAVKLLSQVGHLPQTFLFDSHTGTYRDIAGTKFTPDEVRLLLSTDEVIIKPRISQGQGRYVVKVPKCDIPTLNNLKHTRDRYSLVQELIPYSAICRVFCFGGNSPDYVTVDTPTAEDWKVSVCLNKLQTVASADQFCEQVDLALYIQDQLGGVVNFIDVFVTPTGPVLSEVNTACNLTIHSRLTHLNFARMIVQQILDMEVDNV